MNIESYEPYHIGTKLGLNVNAGTLKNKLRKHLKEESYEDKELVQSPINIENIIEILGIKEETKIELNYTTHSVNVIGDQPATVIKHFEKIIESFTKIGYDTNVVVQFYEIITNVVIKYDKNPMELMANAIRLDIEKLTNVRKSLDARELSIESLRISNRLKPELMDILTSLIIQPSPVNPSNSFLIKIIYRSKSIAEIRSFHNELESTVLYIINSLDDSDSLEAQQCRN